MAIQFTCKGFAAAALLAFGGCALMPSESQNPSFAEIREIRKSEFPKYLSGITYAGDSLYYVVADREGKMYPLTIKLNYSGAPTKPIREFDPATGQRLGNLDLPGVFRKFRPNLAFEALAISPDGRDLWTANEEALSCDGATACNKRGSLVRLCRFRRADANDPWKLDGMWAYETDPTNGQAYKGFLASGVSGLMVEQGGAVYALEREFSQTLLPGFRARIYKLDVSNAEKVSETPFCEKKPERTVRKELVFGKATGIAMYEGCCFGPELKDGRLVVLCSDGDDRVAHAFLYLSAP